MKNIVIFCVAVSLSQSALLAETASYSPPSPAREVVAEKLDWHAAKRERAVPVKLYFPKEGTGPFPLVVFSHGLGGSREGYEYLGKHWAGCGYVSCPARSHFQVVCPEMTA